MYINEKVKGKSRNFPVTYHAEVLNWNDVSSKSGIYCIVNTVDQKVYIGSSEDMQVRLGQHRVNLYGNKHHCKFLQIAWNKSNEDNWKFKVLEFCAVSQLNVMEQLYISRYEGKLYNQYKIVARKGASFEKINYLNAYQNKLISDLKLNPTKFELFLNKISFFKKMALYFYHKRRISTIKQEVMQMRANLKIDRQWN